MLTRRPAPLPLTRRRLLRGATAMTAAYMLTGCSKTNQSATVAASPYAQPIPTGTLTAATLSVSTQTMGAVGKNFIGLSYQKNAMQQKLFVPTNTNLIGLLQRLGPGVFRIGGIPVEQNVWNATGAGSTAGQIAPKDVDALAAFLAATGWQCLYAVNLKGYPPSGVSLSSGTVAAVATTPALAAAEVAYVAKALGSSLLGIEIGNESDQYGWAFSQFEAQWSAMRAAIIASTPGVGITGPATGGNVTGWTIPFGQTMTSSQITSLTQHYYVGCGCNGTTQITDLVKYPDSFFITNYLQPLQTTSAALALPYRISEANAYYSWMGVTGLDDAYGTALWLLDFMFTCAQYNAAGVNMHGGSDGPSYTPIADNNVGTVLGARPEYYGMELFSLAGTGPLNTTTLSVGSLNVSAFAVKTAGGLNVVINNKDATNNLNMTITLPQAIHTATLLELTQLSSGQTGPTLAASPVSDTSGDQSAGTNFQGSEINANGTFGTGTSDPAYIPYTLSPDGTKVTCYVPALSAVLIQTVPVVNQTS